MTALALVASGCAGTITEDGGGSAGPDDPVAFCSQPQPGSSPVRRLTRFEYNNTIRDLLGDDSRPASSFAPEERALGFDNNAEVLGVTPIQAEQFMVAAEEISARADVNGLNECDPAAHDQGEAGCGRDFVVELGRRAYRRPLDEAEVAALMVVYEWGVAEHDHETALRLVLQAMLQSPHFLYRVELAEGPVGGEPVPVVDYEMASRLSYLLWGTMPDDQLFAAAAAGELRTDEQVRFHAERMVADPRARAAVRHFYDQWLMLEEVDHLEKDSGVYPDFSPALAKLFGAETRAFLDYVIWEGDGSVETMLTADFTFANAELADFYGLEGVAGDELVFVPLADGERGGFLTHASVLASHAQANQSSPIHRGVFVRQQILCMPLPPPPDDIAIVPPDLDPDLTTRERFEQHSSDPSCRGCHELIDGIGFGFERFDGLGQYRETENGQPVDASGELVATDVDGPFEGVAELAARLASSEQVNNCVTTQWFRFAYGRAEQMDDVCSTTQLAQQFAASGNNMRELLVALTQTDAFLFRRAAVGGN